MVAVKSKGGDVMRWLNYLENKYKSGTDASPVYAFDGDAFTPIEFGEMDKYKGKIPTKSSLEELAMRTGVVRQIIIAPIHRNTTYELLSRSKGVIFEFMDYTGKTHLIPVYSFHTDTPHPHVHILLFSPYPSHLYIKPTQLEVLKYITFRHFREPIGKVTYLKLVEEKIDSVTEKEKPFWKKRLKLVAVATDQVRNEINKEIEEMER